MKEYYNNDIRPVDVDKAWDMLQARLESDQLLINNPDSHFIKKQNKLYRRVAAIAAVCIGVVLSTLFIINRPETHLISLQNTDKGSLVTMLQDGSVIYLASNASLGYPESFTSDKRKVTLTGNALFDVAADKNRPFIIDANGMQIEVVGTTFSIKSSSKNNFILSVKEGTVKVRQKNEGSFTSVEAGETVRLNAGKLNKSKTTDSYTFNGFTEKIHFKDEKLGNIINVINRMSGDEIIYADQSVNERTLNVTFDNNTLADMTELICLALNLSYTTKQDTFFIFQP